MASNMVPLWRCVLPVQVALYSFILCLVLLCILPSTIAQDLDVNNLYSFTLQCQPGTVPSMVEYANGTTCRLCDGTTLQCLGCNGSPQTPLQVFDACDRCGTTSNSQLAAGSSCGVTSAFDRCDVPGGEGTTCSGATQLQMVKISSVPAKDSTVAGAVQLTIESDDPNVQIYYSIITIKTWNALGNNRTVPLPVTRRNLYDGPVTLIYASLVKAYATRSGSIESPVTWGTLRLLSADQTPTGLPLWQIILIVAGSVILVGAAVYFFVMRYRRKHGLSKPTLPSPNSLRKGSLGNILQDAKGAKTADEKGFHLLHDKQYRVLHAYESQNWDELSIVPGDILTLVDKKGTLHEKESDQWLLCRSERLNGQVGIVPCNFVEPLFVDDKAKLDNFLGGLSPSPTDLYSNDRARLGSESNIRRPSAPAVAVKKSLPANGRAPPVIIPAQPIVPLYESMAADSQLYDEYYGDSSHQNYDDIVESVVYDNVQSNAYSGRRK